jgi:MFS family permease
MADKSLEYKRKVSVAAATIISLACGTNYVFSAWGPQFAIKLHLTATETNLVAVFGNLGMYGSGIPVGILTDAKGAKPGTIIGAFLLGGGYFALHRAYVGGAGSFSVPLLCLFSFMTGCGSSFAFAGSIKTSAVNWPNHRGTATAFPLSGFGLSAMFFSVLATALFPHNADDFLLMLALLTFLLILGASFFLKVVPQPHDYSAIGTEQARARTESSPLRRTKSASRGRGRGRRRPSPEPDTPDAHYDGAASSTVYMESDDPLKHDKHIPATIEQDESSSLISSDDIEDSKSYTTRPPAHGGSLLNTRGFGLLKHIDFYQQFMMMGMLTGIGLMTINNIGNDAKALWRAYDPSKTEEWIEGRQLMHVSIISMLSFVGRLLSGIGSDVIIKKLHMSRIWCLFLSSCIFFFAQLIGATLSNPHFLFLLSAFTGLAYGFLFGVFPAIIAETFGIGGLSQNWGWMTLSPVIFSQVFNIVYGRILDANTVVESDGTRECDGGKGCYEGAYWITMGGSVAVVGISLWTIGHQWRVRMRRRGEVGEEGRGEEP